MINFIPHNTIFYVWLRLGTLGAIALFWMVGSAVVAACRPARHRDRDLALIGTLAPCAIIGWLLQGWYDKGIVAFRIIVIVGCLLGAIEAAAVGRRLPL